MKTGGLWSMLPAFAYSYTIRILQKVRIDPEYCFYTGLIFQTSHLQTGSFASLRKASVIVKDHDIPAFIAIIF